MGCKEKGYLTKEFEQIRLLEDSLDMQFQWLKTIDFQIYADRQYEMNNDLYFLENANIDLFPNYKIEVVKNYKELERLFKFILKRIKWLEVESKKSIDQINRLVSDMNAGKAAPVLANHVKYKSGLTMQEKNRIHLQDEMDIGKDLIFKYNDLRRKIEQADDEYLKQSIEIRNLIEGIRNNVKKN